MKTNPNTPTPKPVREKKSDGMFIASMVGCGALFLILLGGIGAGVNDFLLANKHEWLSDAAAFASALGIAAGFLSTFIVADYLANKEDKEKSNPSKNG
ncbi:hypothetical protein I7860_08510 [Pseudomonas tolaasii]|uniref:hypothetical protein n=1 Tax=Pseudomonas tolaasii TaxID=29442 RepID=UPI001C599AE7|nr:hypothetical protein [Pseudomonas tolaasii]MBW1246713.1 hypothetical protein [Pseudomonas tolaasii]